MISRTQLNGLIDDRRTTRLASTQAFGLWVITFAPARIPDLGVLGMYKKLEVPQRSEGFDALYYVQIDPTGKFRVEEWAD